MAKILFISDNFLNEGLGIMYLSSYLKEGGHTVELILLSECGTIEILLDYIEKEDPDIIGFSVMTPQVSRFLDTSKIIKERTGRLIIWGGPHCMFMKDNVMSFGCVDIVCVGDGEEALLTLMDRIRDGQAYTDIPSLCIFNDSEWTVNPLGSLDQNLDKYPFPDRELYYDKYSLLKNFSLKRTITSRGCPYKCSYCFEPTYFDMYKGKGKVFRRHSVDYAIAEIRQIIDKFPLTHVHFSDDIFNLNKTWVKEFTARFKQEIDLPFTCNIELTSVDEDVIKALAAGGCRGVTFGLESGIEKTRIEILNKHIPDSRYVEMTALLHKYGVKFLMNEMICLPNESLDDAIAGLRFAATLKPYGIRFSVLKMYLGTDLAKQALINGWSEATGEFTLKARDAHNDFERIKRIVWVGSIFVQFPFLLTVAKRLLSLKLPKIFSKLILLSHWNDIKFFRISLWQAWQFYRASREDFVRGISYEQPDTFQENDTPEPDAASFKGVIDWGGSEQKDTYSSATQEDRKTPSENF